MNSMRPHSIITALFAVSMLAGCATVQYVPVAISPVAGSAALVPKSLAQEVVIPLATGYQRTLPAGSFWTMAGTIPQGTVYRRHKDVFTLEGAHVHEAYLVVEQGRLVGFYLPAERGFSPQQPSLPITLQE
jgi:hypothetical protein